MATVACMQTKASARKILDMQALAMTLQIWNGVIPTFSVRAEQSSWA